MKIKSTALQQLQELITSITVSAISEPLESVSASENISKALAIMNARSFDVLGVNDDHGTIVGYIEKADFQKGSVKDFIKKFNVENIISHSACLEDRFLDIYNRGQMFVLNGDGIRGIVTAADLQKIPIRIMIFGIISLLEMSLIEWISIRYPQDEWKDLISPERLDKAWKLYEERKRVNQEISLVVCLQLCDKTTILLKSDENIYSQIGFTSNGKAKDVFKKIQNLRDYLAHSQDLTEKMEWPEIAYLLQQAKAVTDYLLNFNETEGPLEAR